MGYVFNGRKSKKVFGSNFPKTNFESLYKYIMVTIANRCKTTQDLHSLFNLDACFPKKIRTNNGIIAQNNINKYIFRLDELNHIANFNAN